VNPTEAVVQQIVATSQTATSIRCSRNSTNVGSRTFTFRKNGANTSLTCTIPGGATSGSGTGSVSLSAGDLVDVQLPNPYDSAAHSFAVGTE